MTYRIALLLTLMTALPAVGQDAPRYDSVPGWSFICTFAGTENQPPETLILLHHSQVPETPVMILPGDISVAAVILPGTDPQHDFVRTFHTGPQDGVVRMLTLATSTTLAFYSEHGAGDIGAWHRSYEATCEKQALAAKEN